MRRAARRRVRRLHPPAGSEEGRTAEDSVLRPRQRGGAGREWYEARCLLALGTAGGEAVRGTLRQGCYAVSVTCSGSLQDHLADLRRRSVLAVYVAFRLPASSRRFSPFLAVLWHGRGSRPVAFAHASTTRHDQMSAWRSSATGSGRSGWRRRQTWTASRCAMSRRSAISAAPTRRTVGLAPRIDLGPRARRQQRCPGLHGAARPRSRVRLQRVGQHA
jgi:hypothetical protein